jgi:hypothetical protein
MSTARGKQNRLSRPTVWFSVFAMVCVVATTAYVIARAYRAQVGSGHASPDLVAVASDAARADRDALDDIRSRPHVYYRSVRGDEFGKVVVAALDAPNDRRVVTTLLCDRVDFGRERGLCLASGHRTLGPSSVAQIVDRDFLVRAAVALPGTPIRARLSPDERYAAVTVFVTGERYDSDFTTRTAIIDMRSGLSVGDLEQFTTLRDGRAFARVDFNFWGVTFGADSRRFYATLGTSGTRFLVEGDVERREMRVIRENVECPSLDPSQRFIGFKSRVPGASEWRLHVLELAAEREWAIEQEGRSIDDQVEWLDEGHILYTFVGARGLPEEAMHVWMSPASPEDRSPPVIFIRAANSPSIVRP